MTNVTPTAIDTLAAYEHGADRYAEIVGYAVTGPMKAWLDRALILVPRGSRILELGSGHGRDADYIQSLGYDIECSDAATAFVDRLRQRGHQARVLNILTDEDVTNGRGGLYDLILANAVLLHFSPEQFLAVLARVARSLRQQGVFAFSMLEGTGVNVSSNMLEMPRFFQFWSQQELLTTLRRAGFSVHSHTATDGWLHVVARRRRGKGAVAVPARDQLHTLELYQTLGNTGKVAERLGVAPNTIHRRLMNLGLRLPPRGGWQSRSSLAELNGQAWLDQLTRRLQTEAAREA